jgi:hypothetical protein
MSDRVDGAMYPRAQGSHWRGAAPSVGLCSGGGSLAAWVRQYDRCVEARLLERQPWPALSGCQSISQSASRPPGRVSEEQSQRHSLSFSLSLAQLHSCSPSRRRPMYRRRHEGPSADRTADVGEHSLPLPRRRRGPAARAAAHGGRQQALRVLTGKAATAKSGGRGRRRRGRRAWRGLAGGRTRFTSPFAPR